MNMLLFRVSLVNINHRRRLFKASKNLIKNNLVLLPRGFQLTVASRKSMLLKQTKFRSVKNRWSYLPKITYSS